MAVAQARAEQGAGKWDNPNTYNFCPIEGLAAAPSAATAAGGAVVHRVPGQQGQLSDQQRMLKYGATETELVEEGKARWVARVAAINKPRSDALIETPYESTGPLGYQQMWCGGPDAYKVWSALPAVHSAWHVKPHSPSGNMQYTRAPAGDLRPLYKTLASRYRMLIYSGDSDGCVPHVGTEEWTTALGYPVSSAWRPWLANNTGGNDSAIAVGYTQSFGGDTKDYRFATVMGSGHEVPTFKPVPAYAMIKRFEAGGEL
eukprot:SAG31_NODE_4791_length_2954_cov_2.206305_2_plen_259_part_00